MMLLGLLEGIFQFVSFKLANKREEIYFVHIVLYIQTMFKTYTSQIKKKSCHCKIKLRKWKEQ